VNLFINICSYIEGEIAIENSDKRVP